MHHRLTINALGPRILRPSIPKSKCASALAHAAPWRRAFQSTTPRQVKNQAYSPYVKPLPIL